jgi:hypothetical protein
MNIDSDYSPMRRLRHIGRGQERDCSTPTRSAFASYDVEQNSERPDALEGKQPSDFPSRFPVKLELAINIKTAMTLGLPSPPSLLARTNETIERKLL